MRILVVDDHEVVRRGICSILATESSLTLCGEAVDGKDAVEKAKVLRPDIIVMDITMPQMNGLDATREIKRLLPDTEIVIVSQHEAPEMVRQAFNAGARAYVVKSTVARELLAAIAKVNRGEPFVKAAETVDASKSLDPTDVLQRSAAFEKALRESEEKFRSAMTNMAEGLVMLDAQARITYTNPAAETLFGWTSAELLGKNMHEKTHYKRPDGSPFPAANCPLLQVLRSGAAVREQEDLFIRKDGSFLPVVFSASPVKTEPATGGMVICFRDDTKRRQTEDELQDLVQTLESRVCERTFQLENATAKLRELTGTLLQTQDEERRRIARELHDGVGQLIVAMSMNLTNIVCEKGRLSPEARQTLDQNQALIEQTSREIRTMSHLLHPPLLDEVGLDSALRWYVDGFSERSKITVETKLARGFSEDLPRELALSVFRIVQESLTNIHRHSESPIALVQINRSSQEIKVVVEDEGKGIPPETQSKISSGELTGVGLRGMRERVRQFGGHLEVSSNGNGTRVVAALPVPCGPDREDKFAELIDNDNATPLLKADINIMGSSRQPATILCVDDELTGLLARKLLLESAGYRVVQARSGPEGIRAFEEGRIDAVILDYWMSGMKGTAVASELKRINPSVPIIVLSGVSDLPGEAAGLVDLWLLKGSHRAEQLLESISALLERRPT